MKKITVKIEMRFSHSQDEDDLELLVKDFDHAVGQFITQQTLERSLYYMYHSFKKVA